MTDPQNESQRMPTEEELREALERVRVEDLILETVVSLINLGGAKAATDREQLRIAIEGVRALLPLVEDRLGPDAAAIRNALSQLQMMYARGPGTGEGGEEPAPGGGEPQTPAPDPGGPGPAQSSGRLWVPGQ